MNFKITKKMGLLKMEWLDSISVFTFEFKLTSHAVIFKLIFTFRVTATDEVMLDIVLSGRVRTCG